MPVKLNSSGGGSVTLDLGSTGSTYTQTLPMINGSLVAADSGGNVSVSGTGSFTGNVGIGGATAGQSGYRFALQGYAASAVPLYLHSDATNAYLYSPNPVYMGSTGANPTVLVSNNTARLTVDSGGNVGIAENLSVSGNATVRGGNVVTSNASAIGQIPFSTNGTSFVATQKITQATAVTTTTTSFTGATVGANTALTASSVTGTIQIGQVIGGTGLTAGTVITAGSGSSWTISPASTGTVSGTITVRGVDFLNIPSWAKRITVMFNGVSTSGTSIVQIQMGTSSGIITSGYKSTASYSAAAGTQYAYATTGFLTESSYASAALTRAGFYVFTSLGSNTWVGSGTNGGDATAQTTFALAGGVTLSGVLDRVRITTVNGTDTFDAGSINILYE